LSSCALAAVPAEIPTCLSCLSSGLDALYFRCVLGWTFHILVCTATFVSELCGAIWLYI
jgi:hypothetical protein